MSHMNALDIERQEAGLDIEDVESLQEGFRHHNGRHPDFEELCGMIRDTPKRTTKPRRPRFQAVTEGGHTCGHRHRTIEGAMRCYDRLDRHTGAMIEVM